MDKERILRLASGRLESEKKHRIDLLRQESGLDREPFDRTVSELAAEGIIKLVGKDTSAMTEDQIQGLYRPEGEGNPFVNIVWQKDPVRFLFVFRSECLETYERAGKSPKKAYSTLCETLPGLAKEMPFNTFNQYITPLYKLSGLFEQKAGHDDMLAELQAENDALRAKTEKMGIESMEARQKVTRLQSAHASAEAYAANCIRQTEALETENGNLRETLAGLTEINAKLEREIKAENENLGEEKQQPEYSVTEPKKENVDMDTQNRIERRLEAVAAMLEKQQTRIEQLERGKTETGVSAAKIPETSAPDKTAEAPRKIGSWTVSVNSKGYYTAAKHFPPGDAFRPNGGTVSFHLGGVKKIGQFSAILRKKLTDRGLEPDF